MRVQDSLVQRPGMAWFFTLNPGIVGWDVENNLPKRADLCARTVRGMLPQ